MKTALSPSLTDRYITAVGTRLDEKNRPDIERELRATIADMAEGEFGHLDPEAAERAALEALGDPRKLAAAYRGTPQYLIGPDQFPQWWQMMRVTILVASIVALVTFASTLVRVSLTETGATAILGKGLGGGLGEAIGAGVQTAFVMAGIVTLVFALVERDQGKNQDVKKALDQTSEALKKSGFNKPWSVEQLPRAHEQRAFKLADTIASIVAYALLLAFLAFSWGHLGSERFIVDIKPEFYFNAPLLNPSVAAVLVPILVALAAYGLVTNIVLLIKRRYTRSIAIALWVDAGLGIALAVTLLSWGVSILHPEIVAEIARASHGSHWVMTSQNIVLVMVICIGLWECFDVWRKYRKDAAHR